jgi:branched-chain amino acid transport system substrate-binding protein
MRRTQTWRLVAVLSALAITAMACGKDDNNNSASSSNSGGSSSSSSSAFINPKEDCKDYKPTQGISNGTITVGTVRPAEGPYAIYDTVTTGIEKYFASVNSHGGLKAGDGKTYKLNLVKEDDGYDPGRTPAAVKKLVEQDGIFAMVGEIGTETSLSVRQYMNDNCVPSISLATGSPEWNDAAKYPWYISGLPSYATEAHAFMDFLAKQKPDATIAILFQSDDFGKSYEAAIKKYIADNGNKMKIAAEQSFDPSSGQTTEGVTTQLAASKADVFFVGIGGTPCPQTLKFIPADWKPMTYVSITCSGKLALSLAGGADEGIYSTQATYDPSNPADQSTPAVQQFMTDGQAQGLSSSDLQGGIVSAGWGFGQIFTKGLELTKHVTRADLMNTMYSFKDQNFGLLRPEVKLTTNGAKDPWLIESLRVVHRVNGAWQEATPVQDYNGKSISFTG